ncbi:Uncharacterised protein [Mycobacteroides abscessus subsp. abscessus]|nr:Uncharacterised protein [Mycobacteroides abscessus subsp. abscessus]
MAAAHTGTTLAADSINFINEDDGRSSLFSLIKQITHTRSPDTNEHFNEI